MFKWEDVVPELYEEFPELTHESIDKICKTGLARVLKLLRDKEELNVKLEDAQQIKFYFPMSPEKQSELTTHNMFRRKRRAERLLQNGEASK